MKVYREETPRKGKTPEGVEREPTLQRTKVQALIFHPGSQVVTKIWPHLSVCNRFRGSNRPAPFGAATHSSSRRRAVRMARAAGDPAWRHTSRAKADNTPSSSHAGPNSQAAAAKAK